MEFPEYTAVNVLAPPASCDALRRQELTAVKLGPVGSSVADSRKVGPSIRFPVPLGAPPTPGLAVTVTVRVVPSPYWREDAPPIRFTVNELSTSVPVFWKAPMLEPYRPRSFPSRYSHRLEPGELPLGSHQPTLHERPSCCPQPTARRGREGVKIWRRICHMDELWIRIQRTASSPLVVCSANSA